jgi:flagellar biogenesis protein FliO
LQTLETVSLGNKRTVLLVQVDGQEFLLGATDQALSLLAKLDRPRDKEKITTLRTSPAAAELVASFNSSVQ